MEFIKLPLNEFAGIEQPTQPVKLNNCCNIIDWSLFVESHFDIVKANNGNNQFLPFLERLRSAKDKIQSSLTI